MTDGTQKTILVSKPDGQDQQHEASETAAAASTWMAGGSQTRFNNIYLGEKYDATLDTQFQGWSTVGCVARIPQH
jgi:hypothetical protein